MADDQRQPPWGDAYPAAVAIGLLGLCPYLVLTTAATQLTPVLTRDLGTTETSLQLVDGLANAGYALGAVVAAYLGQKLLQRRLFLVYEALFVLGTLVALLAQDGLVFGVGRVVQGAATGLMLVAALPPLVVRFGVAKLPVTVVIVNVGLFGAATVGPLVAQVTGSAWRVLFGVVGVLGLLGLGAAARGYARSAPPNPDLRLEPSVLPLALAATVLPFFATASLARGSFTSPVVLVPGVLGLLALVVLVVTQYRAEDPLIPVKALSTSLPVTGTLVAMVAGAVFVSLLGLLQLLLSDVARSGSVLPYAGLPVGLVVAAPLFGLLLRTRHVPVLVNSGFLALIAAAVVLLATEDAHPVGGGVAAGVLLGYGAGASVSPGLFLAAFGVPSAALGRAFALVELLRGEAAFAVAPVVLAVAKAADDPARGVRTGLVAMLVLSVVGLLVSLLVPLLSGHRLRAPDLEEWLEGDGKALPSPLVGSLVRPVDDPEAEPLRRR